MIAELNFSNTKIFFICLVLPVLATVFLPYCIYIIPVLFIIPFILLYKEKSIILILIFSYLVFTSYLNENLRIIINLAGFAFLVFLYLKRFGLSFEHLKTLDKEFKIFLFILLLSMILSSLFSSYIFISLKSVLQLMIFLIICYVFYSFIESREEIYSIIYILIFVSLIVGIGVLYQVISLGFELFLTQTKTLVRASGIYNNPNAVGLLYAITFPLLFSFFFFKSEFRKIVKVALFILFLFLLSVLFLTDSRASILSVAVSVFYIAFVLKRKNFLIATSILMLILVILLFIPSIQNLISLFIRSDRILSNTRWYYWSIAFHIIQGNPIWGVGPGIFEEYIYKYLPVMLGSFAEHELYWGRSGTAHNFFLFRVTELGIPGLIIGIWIFKFAFKYSKSAIKKIKDIDYNLYVSSIAFRGIIYGMLCRAFLESTGILTHGWITRDLPFWLIFIMIIAINHKLYNRSELLENKI